MKDKFAFFETYKSPTPKRRKLLAKRPFLYKQKRPCFKTPLNWTGSVFPLLIKRCEHTARRAICCKIRGKTPGLIQLVLTVLLFWSRVLLVPAPSFVQESLRTSICFIPLQSRIFSPEALLPPVQKSEKSSCPQTFLPAILGAGNGCANFMDTWKKCVLSAGKPMSIKFRVLGGGLGGGGRLIYYQYWC